MIDEDHNSAKSGLGPRLGDSAYEALKDRISRGVYRPGDKLTVRSVAETLGVSSTPARDAINRLAAENALVYAGPKTVIIPILSERDLKEVTVIRIALEGLAAEEAATRCTADDLATLKSLQGMINNGLEKRDYASVLWHNKEFHFLVYARSGLPHLVDLIEAQWLRVGPSFYGLYPEFAEEKYGVRNHEMAMDAIQERDCRALRAAFEGDIRTGYLRLRSALRARVSQ
ncbi:MULTISPECIES: GntR family transcriptional regulator [unclassified Shinella]|uniref:GntR family transcriptional regulator n=1 Tax=unclassified Shinella TaxID=2643062 RepID=UPI00225D2799|nr:GntR family transcriptional regulator [Shinella sp. YE25]MDC7260152.1 GntR family transcriptional regulator [Shinella sp. YE25]CAI0341096.1 Transcriptional regulator, GntR family [Rhizobiaceae bacterium]CAK7262137.1 Transcriptional regulator, GntR family [Shinella sp. WSC3-e]